jgi:uncharacterized protein involved in exopolysaccharide biosynthesis
MDRDPESQGWPLREYLQILVRRRWLALAAFVAVLATVAVGTYVQTPAYEAVARVLIDRQVPRVANVPDVVSTDDSAAFFRTQVRTQIEVIRSRPLVAKVIGPPGLADRSPGLATARDPIAAFLSAVLVEPVGETGVVGIRVTHRDPAFAAEAANALARAYVDHSLEQRLAAARQALAWLEPQVRQWETRVTASELALQKYRENADLVALEEKKTLAVRKLEEFNAAYIDAKTKRLEIEARLSELRKAAHDPELLETVALDSPLIQRLRGDLVTLEVKHSQLVRAYTDRYPEVLRVKAEIQETRGKIREEVGRALQGVESELKALRSREAAMAAAVTQHREEAQTLEKIKIQHASLHREAEANLQLYSSLLQRAKETSLTQGLDTTNVSILEEAVVPFTPTKPRTMLNMTIAVLLGLIVAPIVAFFVEYMDDIVRSPEQVEELGVPVFGQIPTFPSQRGA